LSRENIDSPTFYRNIVLSYPNIYRTKNYISQVRNNIDVIMLHEFISKYSQNRFIQDSGSNFFNSSFFVSDDKLYNFRKYIEDIQVCFINTGFIFIEKIFHEWR
jgi:hypothetical protein